VLAAVDRTPKLGLTDARVKNITKCIHIHKSIVERKAAEERGGK
jgi:hypothetical protein